MNIPVESSMSAQEDHISDLEKAGTNRNILLQRNKCGDSCILQ